MPAVDPGKSKPTMSFEHINAFVEAAVRTFTDMCEVQTERDGDLQVRKGMFGTYDLIGLIGLSGDVRGAVMLTMPVLTGKRLVSSFIGEPIRETGADLMDGYGELVNIIAGAAAARMGDGHVQISLPAVFIGKDMKTSAQNNRPWIIIPMKFESWGKYNIEISREGV